MSKYAIFAKRLRQLREEMRLTQKEFSEKVGCTQATLSAYENTPKNPSLDIVQDIARKCDISMDWLCGLSDKKNQKTYINTYSDIGILLLDISAYTKVDIRQINYFDEKSVEHYTTTGLIFEDSKLNEFLQKWKKIKDLYDEDIIDNETYLSTMSGLFNTFEIPRQ